jgi:hypothetical protein
MRKLLAIFFLLGAPAARPDSCVLPATEGYVSDDGSVVVRIEFGRPKAFYPDPKDCVATIAKWNEKDRGYRFLRSVVLRNEIGPSTAVISNDARFLVTFDDFCVSGTSENAVVIYDLEKGSVVACGIEDFLPKAYREALHRSVSHIEWRENHPWLNDGERHVRVSPDFRTKEGISIIIDLATNSITLDPPQPQ